jgi:hypothetical protein
MKKFYISFAVSVLTVAATAQNFSWVKQFSGNAYSDARVVTTDVSGNVYVAGVFSDTVDLDPGPETFTLASVGNENVYIMKLNSSGTALWGKQIGGNDPRNIKVNSNGDIYLTGLFGTSGIDFDPGPGTYTLSYSGLNDIFIMKMDNNGNFIWAESMGTSNDEYTAHNGLALDASGNLLITGTFINTIDVDPGPATVNLTSAGMQDAFLLMLDPSGAFVWVKQISGTNSEILRPVTIDNGGNILLAGDFGGTTDFDPGAGVFNMTASGSLDVFICKLSATGNFIWAKQFAGTAYTSAGAIVTDASGSIIMEGGFIATVDMDPSPATYTFTTSAILNRGDVFIVKLNSSGNFIWAAQLGDPTAADDANNLAVDNAGNIYTAGNFDGSNADYDPGPGAYILSSSGNSDFFFCELTSSGNFSDAFSIGSANDEVLWDMNLHSSGAIYIGGSFWGTCDFDPGPSTAILSPVGNPDAFLVKLLSATAGIKDHVIDRPVNVFPNPGNGIYLMQLPEPATIRITNGLGSTITEFQHDNESDINISAYPAGIYFIEATCRQKCYHAKLIKE